MHTQLTQVMAAQRIEELQRVAARRPIARRARRSAATPSAGEALTLRLARREDARGLAVLAELDSTQPPTGTILLAEIEGRLVAAIGLEQGTVIADPFHPTSEVVGLLRARARHLACVARPAARSRRWAGLRRRAWVLR